jgi:hypothetical protein
MIRRCRRSVGFSVLQAPGLQLADMPPELLIASSFLPECRRVILPTHLAATARQHTLCVGHAIGCSDYAERISGACMLTARWNNHVVRIQTLARQG